MDLRSYNYHIKLNDDEYLLPWSFIYPADRPFPRKPLDQDTEPRWGSYNPNHVLGEEHPHFICRMYNDMVARDNQLLRGELLTILRIMVGQHIWARLLKHMVVPVLLVSLVGPKCARVIESYFDGQQLVVRCGKLIDFSFHSVAGFKSLAKWYMSRPIGDTTKA